MSAPRISSLTDAVTVRQMRQHHRPIGRRIHLGRAVVSGIET